MVRIMINCKRLAAFMAAAAVLTAVHIPSAAELKYPHECEVVASLGIIDDVSDEEFSPSDAVSRAEFLSYVMSAVGQGGGLAESSGYLDVRPEYWAAGIIDTADRMGVISGYSSGYFRPDKEITYEEAVCMLVAGLGYGGVAEQKGAFPDGYMQTASSIGLLNGIGAAQTIDKETAVKLIYNALDVPVMLADGITVDGSERYRTDKDINLLNEYHDISSERGIVEANSTTSLSDAGVSDNKVRINGKEYFVGNTAAADLLGYSVKFYYRYDKTADESTILYIEEYKNKTEEFLTDEIKDFGNSAYDLYKNERKNSTYKARISNIADVIYNGKAVTKYDDAMLRPDYGRIKLIDNNGDNIYDVVIVDSYEVLIVQNFGQDVGKIYDKYNGVVIDLKTYEEYVVLGDAMQPVDEGIIKEYSVLFVVESVDKSFAKLIVSNKSVSGYIESVDIDSGESTVIINDTEYKTGARLPDDTLNDRGRSMNFYLDANGRIQAVKAGATIGTQYGYLVNARIIENDDGIEVALLKIFTSDGKFLDASTSAKKLKLDGTAKAEAKAVEAKLMNEKGAKRQIIGYRLNDDGEICMLDTAGVMSGTDDILGHDISSNGRYKTKNATISGKVGLAANTVVFSVPSDETDEEEHSFLAGTLTMIPNDTEMNNGFDAYRTTKDSPLSDILVIYDLNSSGMQKQENFSVILKIKTEMNEDNEVIPTVKYFKGGNVNEAKCTDERVLNNIKDFSGKNLGKYPLGKGDTVRIALNSQGEITDIELHYDYSKKTMLTTNNPASFTAAPGMMLMNVYNKYEDIIITTDKIPNKDMTIDNGSFVFFKAGNYDVIVYDEELDGCVKAGSVSDINDFVHNGQYSRAYISTWYGEPLSMVVYR